MTRDNRRVLRVLPVIAYFAFHIYTLVAIIQTPDDEHQHLPKVMWIVLTIAAPFIGGVCWWLIGRKKLTFPRVDLPKREQRPRGPLGPDDDPDFLKGL